MTFCALFGDHSRTKNYQGLCKFLLVNGCKSVGWCFSCFHPPFKPAQRNGSIGNCKLLVKSNHLLNIINEMQHLPQSRAATPIQSTTHIPQSWAAAVIEDLASNWMKETQEKGKDGEWPDITTTLLHLLLPNKQVHRVYYWALCFLQVQCQLAHQGKESQWGDWTIVVAVLLGLWYTTFKL